MTEVLDGDLLGLDRRTTPIQVLLVEDNPGDAGLAYEQLEEFPGVEFDVRQVTRLSAAEEMLSTGAVDAVILDLNLPDCDGMETFRRTKRHHGGAPLVVLTGGITADMQRMLVAEGASDVIDKNNATRPRLLARSVLYAVSRYEAEQHARSVAALVAADLDAIVVADDSGILCYVNGAATRFFGRDAGELIGRRTGFSVADGAIAEIDVVVGDVHRCGEMRTVRVDWRGQPATLAAIRDVTEHRSVVEQLHESQKAEALGRLAGGIAHDFNNMLAVILSTTDLLSDSDEILASEFASDMLARIQRAGQRAAGITRQLLTFSRHSPASRIPVDLNRLVTDSVEMFGRLFGGRISVELDLDAAASSVVADPIQLEQVLMNLVINARDALPDGGRIRVGTTVTGLDDAEAGLVAGRYAVLTVADNGIGMSDEVRSRIFEPLFTTKELGKGTGLGLATTFGIVRQTGGDIRVHSELGRGTTFSVRLPLADQPGEWHDGGATEPTAAGTGTVLLVEDEEDLRASIGSILTAAGYSIIEAPDGATALDLALTHAVDLTLTDVVMPGMLGFELAERLGHVRPGMPVVLMTAYPDEGDGWGEGHDAHRCTVLMKPFDRKTLLRTLRQAIRTG